MWQLSRPAMGKFARLGRNIRFNPLPVKFQTLPSHLHSMMDDYLWHYPDSELTDVLAGKKSFQQALDSSPELQAEIFRAPGDSFRRVRSIR